MNKFICLSTIIFVTAVSHAQSSHTDEEFEAYFQAIRKGNSGLFKSLDQEFGDIVLRAMALEEAAEYSRNVIVDYLLERYQFSNDALGVALHSATQAGSHQSVENLLKKGAPVDYKLSGMSPLMRAHQKKYKAIENTLLAAGADKSVLSQDSGNSISEPSWLSKYLSITPARQADLMVIGTLFAVKAVVSVATSYLNARRYCACTFCQEPLYNDIYHARCGNHHFHRACAQSFSYNVKKSMQDFESWRRAECAVFLEHKD